MSTIAVIRGPPCPACRQGDGGLEHQPGLHQDPIFQCLHCLARVFVGVDGFRAAIPEDKAPPVRQDFLMARPFDAGLDGINRQIADFQSIADEHTRKAAYWTRRVAEAKNRRLAHFGLRDSAPVVAGPQVSEAGPSATKEVVANSPEGGHA